MYVVRDWLQGDPLSRLRRPSVWHGRNHDWYHLYSDDVLSMPDTWEYPWYAAWDLAFHAVVFALIDPEFAKRQLITAHARMVHAPNGADPCLRMGIR